MQLMTAFTVALLLVVWLLARRDAQQRELHRRSAVEDNRRLEAIIEERTAALSELSNHLQLVREDEKSKLARDIHDELGGILVSAKMDVGVGRGAGAQARRRIAPRSSSARCRPSTTACRSSAASSRSCAPRCSTTWACRRRSTGRCTRSATAPGWAAPSPRRATTAGIPPHVSIALYRILQEALTNIVKYARAKNVNVDLGVTSDTITLLIEDDGIGIPDDAQTNLLSHGIAGMRQRVRALHGEFSIARRPEGGTLIEVNIPTGRITQTEPEPELA